MSLIELVIALLLLAIALIALLGAALLAQRAVAATATIDRITREVGSVMDSLTAHAQPAAGTRDSGTVLLTWTVVPDSLGSRIVMVADAFDGARPVRLTFEGRHAPR